MNKVLLICYYFPPLGGAGISRPLSLFKHLPEHGIDCDVLTVEPVTYRIYEPELLDGLDKLDGLDWKWVAFARQSR